MGLAHKVLSIVFAVIWCGSLYYDIAYQPRLGHAWYVYKLVMLTNLNFVIIAVFAVFVLTETLAISSEIKASLDFCFYCTIFPVALITCALFWGLYAINPELVMPAWVAQLIPTWLNHVTHTLPVIYIGFDLATVKRLPPPHASSLQMATVHVIIYFIIMTLVRIIDGYWLYPLLELLSWEAFGIMFVVSIVGYYALIRLAVTLSSYIHGVALPVKQKRS